MSVKVVCFDLGGVLARICTTWPDAMAAAGVKGRLNGGPQLQDCREFTLYQAGTMDEVDYLASLSSHLGGVGLSAARDVHNGILLGPYADTLKVVEDLESSSLMTGCLSNTNGLHWHEMTETDRFPAIARLDHKIASHIAGYSKPGLEVYRLFESAAEVEPHEILNFDDVPVYVSAARKAGWNSILIDPDEDTAAQMRSAMETFGLL